MKFADANLFKKIFLIDKLFYCDSFKATIVVIKNSGYF